MNVKHVIISFSIIAFATFILLGLKINTLVTMDSRASQYNETIDNATDDSLHSMLEMMDDMNQTSNLERCSTTFFKALFAGFGVADSQTGSDQLKMYVPILLVTDKDGYYIMYHSLSKNGDYSAEVWTPKQPYFWSGTLSADYLGSSEVYTYQITYSMDDQIKLNLEVQGNSYYFEGVYKDLATQYLEDGMDAGSDSYRALTGFLDRATESGEFLSTEKFDAFKQSVMTYCITKKMNYYVNQHNEIARQYGISYNFSLPESSMDSVSRAISNVSLLAIFQGFPYGQGTDDTYSRFSLSGSRLYKMDKLIVVRDPSTGVLQYHKASCHELDAYRDANGNLNMVSGMLQKNTKKDCAALGAYPCNECKP